MQKCAGEHIKLIMCVSLWVWILPLFNSCLSYPLEEGYEKAKSLAQGSAMFRISYVRQENSIRGHPPSTPNKTEKSLYFNSKFTELERVWISLTNYAKYHSVKR